MFREINDIICSVKLNDQYHMLTNLSRTFRTNKARHECMILICVCVHQLDGITESNLLRLIAYAGVPLNHLTHRTIHFFVFTGLIKVIDQDLGLMRSIYEIEPNDRYNQENFDFAEQEMERIWRTLNG